MFDAHLDLEYIDGRQWRLIEAFGYKPLRGPGIIVPRGFVTDFASVPRFFWRLFPPTGTYGKAAVIHDYLYQFNGVTREQADHIFLEAMEELGVAWVTRHILFLAVRLGGWKPWNSCRKRDKK
jgi:hypothetical protein